MRKTYLIALAALSAAVPSGGVFAQGLSFVPYLDVGFGLDGSSKTLLNGSPVPLESGSGFAFAGGVQLYGLPFITPRVELEYMSFDTGELTYEMGKTTSWGYYWNGQYIYGTFFEITGLAGETSNVSGYGVNGYVALSVIPVVKPYIGLGIMRGTQTFGYIKDSQTTLQYMAGIDLDVQDVPIAGSIEWRYIPMPEANVGGQDFGGKIHTLETSASAIILKLRFKLTPI